MLSLKDDNNGMNLDARAGKTEEAPGAKLSACELMLETISVL